jgi:acyl carrier protein
VEPQTVPIGRPIANTQVYLLDSQLRPVPLGVAGELYIGGVQLARGYLARPALTAERFLPDPFSSEPGARLYRTGDLARYLPSGDIEFLGRIDHQVKVRGFRIELGEVEAALLHHEAVREAVVVARETSTGDKQLVAYVVTSPGADGAAAPGELRDSLRRSLPDYMVPAHFVPLDALPLTPNGKVDRKALPAPAADAGAARDYEPPRTPAEELLAGIWGELLETGRVGRSDNFFELGGHSLLMAQVAARVRDAFDVELPMTVFFQEPTVAGLALAVTQRQAARENADDLNQLLDALEHLSEDELEALLQQQAAGGELLPRLRAGEGNGQT